MYIQVKSSNGIALVPMDARLMSDRKVFIEGEINQEAACGFAKEVMLLSAEGNSPIDVFINSPGGEINAGMLMYDVIQSCPAPIRMYCLGKAYSMGAILFVSGRHGRYMLPHSELMLHEPLVLNGVSGNASSIKSVSDALLETRRKMNEILARHTGRTMKEIEAACSYDHYFDPDQSVSFGLADGVMSFAQMMGGN